MTATLLAVDGTLVVAALAALAAPVFGFLGVIYATRTNSRSAKAAERDAAKAGEKAADAQRIAASAEAWSSQTKAAADVLVKTVETMRVDMDRQDEDHARQVAQLREEHGRQLREVRADLRELREQYEACEEARLDLARQVVLLKRGSNGEA